MAYSTPPTQSTGDLITAAAWNVLVNNWLASTLELATAAGQIPYATGAEAIAMLALGTAGLPLTAGGAAPQWGGDVLMGDAAGIVIGHTAQITEPWTSEAQVLGTGEADTSIFLGLWSNDAVGATLNFIKSRDGVIFDGSYTIVSNDDVVGAVQWFPDDGIDLSTLAANFYAEVDDGSPAAGDIGMAFVWQQMPGGGGILRETMRLAANGKLILKSAAPQLELGVADTTAGRLDLHGNGASSTTGGGIRFHMAADHDGTDDYWLIQSSEDDLSFTLASSGTKMTFEQAGNIVVAGHVHGAEGFRVGVDQAANEIDDASQGGATTTLYIGNASINVTSDGRLKTDIKPTQISGLVLIDALPVRDFTWNDPSDTAEVNRNSRGRWTGMIAQEIVNIAPWVVNAPDRNCPVCLASAECDEHEGYWHIEYEHLVPATVVAIQELYAEVKGLRAEVRELAA